MAWIINKATGENVADILTNRSMTLDEAIRLVGTIDWFSTEIENVKIGDRLFYYDDLELVYEGGEPEQELKEEDYDTVACSLYDGGWRSSDKTDLIGEYRLTEEEADKLYEKLEELELEEHENKEEEEED